MSCFCVLMFLVRGLTSLGVDRLLQINSSENLGGVIEGSGCGSKGGINRLLKGADVHG